MGGVADEEQLPPRRSQCRKASGQEETAEAGKATISPHNNGMAMGNSTSRMLWMAVVSQSNVK